MSINRRMNKDVVHIYNGILALKKNEIGAIYSTMDRPRGNHTK